jgi:hypothetical protein
MRTTIFLWCLIIFGAASVNAEPVYLNCQVNDSAGNVTRINITLDEANKQVSHVIVDTGFTQITTGVFNADTVFFVSDPGRSAEIQYTINRVSLAFQRTVAIIRRSDTGACSIVDAPKNRKF